MSSLITQAAIEIELNCCVELNASHVIPEIPTESKLYQYITISTCKVKNKFSTDSITELVAIPVLMHSYF